MPMGVLLMNSSAQKLLRPADAGPPEGQLLADIAPPLAGLVGPGPMRASFNTPRAANC
jgi:hypothetical protein